MFFVLYEIEGFRSVKTEAEEFCPPLTATRMSAGEATVIARVFKALGHPHRVQLVNLLARSGFPVCVCDLTAALGLAQSTVSHHLRQLVDAGILTREQRGIWAYYALDRDAMHHLSSVVALDEAARPGAAGGRI